MGYKKIELGEKIKEQLMEMIQGEERIIDGTKIKIEKIRQEEIAWEFL